MLDHFHIGKGAVRLTSAFEITTMTYMHSLLCRVSPTTHIAARLPSPTLLKVLANTRTLRVMQVSSEKVVSNGCALYVSYPSLCALRLIPPSTVTGPRK
jgi:hypothetical protein